MWRLLLGPVHPLTRFLASAVMTSTLQSDYPVTRVHTIEVAASPFSAFSAFAAQHWPSLNPVTVDMVSAALIWVFHDRISYHQSRDMSLLSQLWHKIWSSLTIHLRSKPAVLSRTPPLTLTGVYTDFKILQKSLLSPALAQIFNLFTYFCAFKVIPYK